MEEHVKRWNDNMSNGFDNFWCARHFIESGMIELSAEMHLHCEKPDIKIKNLSEIEIDFYYKILSEFGTHPNHSEHLNGYEYQAGITVNTNFENIYYKRFSIKPTVSDKSKSDLTYYFLLGHVTVGVGFNDELENEAAIFEYNIIQCVPIDYIEPEAPQMPAIDETSEVYYDLHTNRFLLYKPSTNQLLKHSVHNIFDEEDVSAPRDDVEPTDDKALHDEADVENSAVLNSSDNSIHQDRGGHEDDIGYANNEVNLANNTGLSSTALTLHDQNIDNVATYGEIDGNNGGGIAQCNIVNDANINNNKPIEDSSFKSNPEPDPPLPLMHDTSKREIDSVSYNEIKISCVADQTKGTPLEENSGKSHDACMSNVMLSNEVCHNVKSVIKARKPQEHQTEYYANGEEDWDSD